MNEGRRIKYEDDIVVIMYGKKEMYRGLEDYSPMNRVDWHFVQTTKDGRGHYEYSKYKKYCISE